MAQFGGEERETRTEHEPHQVLSERPPSTLAILLFDDGRETLYGFARAETLPMEDFDLASRATVLRLPQQPADQRDGAGERDTYDCIDADKAEELIDVVH